MSLAQLKAFVIKEQKNIENAHGKRAMSAFEMLENVDLMIHRYFAEPQTEKGAILLDVFGLMQGLFVAVDALYDLAIGLTSFKYHVNINKNKTLRQLKFIRNDIVGHPTHRTYENGGTGFSILRQKPLNKDEIVYDTYIYQKGKETVDTKTVAFKPLVEAYMDEKETILSDLYGYVHNKDGSTALSESCFRLYETLNMDVLEEVRNKFIDTYSLSKDSKHRFLWRADLLKTLIAWHEDDETLNSFILYMAKVQAGKLYDIALKSANQFGHELYTKLPEALVDFYRFIRSHERTAYPLLENVHDADHPLYQADVQALLSLDPHNGAEQLIRFLLVQTDEQKAFLIGSTLREYRKKQS